jgi:hypothetical protein
MADLTPEQSIERKLRDLIDSCTPEEQAAFFAVLYRAEDEPEVAGFQADAQPWFDLRAHLAAILNGDGGVTPDVGTTLR